MLSYIISGCYGAVLGLLLIIICSKYDDITYNAIFLVTTWVSTILSITFFAELLITSKFSYLVLTIIFISLLIYSILNNLDRYFDLSEEYLDEVN